MVCPICNVMCLLVFWSFLCDIYVHTWSRELPTCGISALRMVVSSIRAFRTTQYTMMSSWCVPFVICLLVSKSFSCDTHTHTHTHTHSQCIHMFVLFCILICLFLFHVSWRKDIPESNKTSFTFTEYALHKHSISFDSIRVSNWVSAHSD